MAFYGLMDKRNSVHYRLPEKPQKRINTKVQGNIIQANKGTEDTSVTKTVMKSQHYFRGRRRRKKKKKTWFQEYKHEQNQVSFLTKENDI